ncbi:family 2 encapsulin nanocompartment cargo protein polyprenyl transferase [Fodinicola feengrottensis]|uniref:Family 2 encapsulin nanocompartment cargo protein polyprenyl transferase n=2 Tax=Fodinicola feengrottensis TaxID=435914 RepID=A0ABN2HB16_9ACTN
MLDAARHTVEPTLRAAVGTLPASMARMAGYHFGWWDEYGTAVRAGGGKALRPALVLAAAKTVGCTGPDAVPAAAAVELVHNFSLVHDDVIDGDETRRHRETVWKVFGASPAILAGDALLMLALDVLAHCEHPATPQAMRTLGATVMELLDGQSADLAFESLSNVDLSECLTMAELKTGALLGSACALGGLYGGATAPQLGHLTAFGRQLGLAFQHVDDLLGIWGDPTVTGKPVFSDLRNRKKSLPVVAALTSGTPAGDELSQLYHRERPLTEAELNRAAQLVDLAGGRDWSQDQADDLLVRALHDLHACAAQNRADADLTALAQLVVQRDR